MRSFAPIVLILRKKRKITDATPKRKVATKKESSPARELPIRPKEKAQMIETIAR
jgi:hypothetical protein